MVFWGTHLVDVFLKNMPVKQIWWKSAVWACVEKMTTLMVLPRTVATMCCSFGGGMIGLAGQYIFFGGKIRVEFVLNCVFGALAAITGKESFNIVHFEPLITHSQIWPNFFSHILTCEVNLIEVLDIIAQMGPYIIFLSLKPTKMTSDFILY